MATWSAFGVTSSASRQWPWPSDAIQRHVSHYVAEWDIDLTLEQIVTFDDYGVSGHKNHQEVSRAMM
ncbi:hypothetical protein OIO90_005907 [Microbotryomycetes sp. JL221]|nr:hypothetical protein OIO90_005907 [Microbotryomycetes sp. JL221]